MINVVLLESLGISSEELASLEAPFAGEAVFKAYQATRDVETLKAEARDADALILANMPLPGEVIRACPRLRFIDVAFTGVDHVDLSAAREMGVQVSNASGYSTQAVAELTVGMAISLLREMDAMQRKLREGGSRAGAVGRELKGRTVGIVGYGKIGRRTGEIMRCLGCRVLANCRTRHTDLPEGVEQVDLPRLLRESDVVILHCPLNPGTRGLIDAEALRLMKPSAVLINAARGPVVVEKDLAQALREGRIAAAASDVFDQEPPLPAGSPLLDAPNTLLTPHIGFATEEAMRLRAGIVFDNLRAWLEGRQENRVEL